MTISVIIPTFNEEGFIGLTVGHLLNAGDRMLLAEVIVVDGQSADGTVAEAEGAGARVLSSERRGRAPQMNAGAAIATGDVLYFVHADSLPPTDYAQHITEAVNGGADSGCMRMRFDRDHWALRLKCWFARFGASGLHYGDQSLFVRADLFHRIKGYREDMTVFEDLDIIERIRAVGSFTVLHGPIVSSARKYGDNGMLRMQLAFYLMYPLYRMGLGQQRLTALYKRIVRQNKI